MRQAIENLGVKVLFGETPGLSGGSTDGSLGGEIEPGPEHLEGFAVITTGGDDSAEHGREGVPGDSQPVGPPPVLAGLVDENLTNIEDHRSDHTRQSRWASAGRLPQPRECQASVRASL